MNEPSRYWRRAVFKDTVGVMSLFRNRLQDKITTATVGSIRHEFICDINGIDFNEVLLADMNLVLLSNMLVKVDLMSIVNSHEIRSPFLDQEVVEFAFGLPSEYKVDGGMKKKIVQDAFRNYLPPELYNRPKHGFEILLLD